MAAVRAVCFDLDGTLCMSDQSVEEIHAAVFDRADVDQLFSPEAVRAVDATDIETAESDVEFYENLYTAVLERQTGRSGVEQSVIHELAAITVDVVDETAVSFRPGAEAAFEYVSDRYPVCLITNGGAETQARKLEELGIADAFDAAVFCDPAAGIDPKPAREPFESAVDRLGIPATELVHVGDSHSADVVGAQRAGFQTVWTPVEESAPLDDAEVDPEPTHTLSTLSALETVL